MGNVVPPRDSAVHLGFSLIGRRGSRGEGRLIVLVGLALWSRSSLDQLEEELHRVQRTRRPLLGMCSRRSRLGGLRGLGGLGGLRKKRKIERKNTQGELERPVMRRRTTGCLTCERLVRNAARSNSPCRGVITGEVTRAGTGAGAGEGEGALVRARVEVDVRADPRAPCPAISSMYRITSGTASLSDS